MSIATEVFEVATRSLRVRPLRASLMAVGPMLGVAVIVGSVGIAASSKGELRDALDRLGSNLIVVEDGAASGGLPAEAGARVGTVPEVRGVAGYGTVRGTLVTSATEPSTSLQPLTGNVITPDAELLEVLELEASIGRGLGPPDEAHRLRSAVLGAGVANLLRVESGSVPPVIYVGDYPFAVVGVLESSQLVPNIDISVMVPRSTAQELFGAAATPSTLLVRVTEGTTDAVAPILATVVTYGGPGAPQVSIPSDLLAARAEVDQTLAATVVALGLLAIAVGSFGIANVMLISVMERRREIGVRRALGHQRRVIGAQFVLEAALVGAAGSVAGAVLGVAFIAVFAWFRDWVPVVDLRLAAAAVLASIVITTLAGLHPARRAARVEPLDAIRAE